LRTIEKCSAVLKKNPKSHPNTFVRDTCELVSKKYNFNIFNIINYNNSAFLNREVSRSRKSEKSDKSGQRVTSRDISFLKGHLSETIFRIAVYLRKGCMPQQEAEQVIKFLAKNCSPELPEKEAILKIKAAYEKYLLKEPSLCQGNSRLG